MVRKSKLKWVIVLVILLVVIGVSKVSHSSVAVGPDVGYQAPGFQLTSLSGASVSLQQYRGKLVYLNFFASWCPPCQAETPDLVKMAKQYGKQIVFLSVNLTASDTIADALLFTKKYHVSYPVLLDTKNTVSKLYNIVGIPTSLFIDRQGVILNRITGGIPSSSIQSDFQQLLHSS